MKRLNVIILFSLFFLLIAIPHGSAVDDGGMISDNHNFTDYYFDCGADADGNGSADSPYKKFTDDRISDNATIHLAGGEYVFEKGRTFSNISFNGAGAGKTILNGNGSKLILN